MKQVGTVVEIDPSHLFADSRKRPIIRVRFDKDGYEIALYPSLLDKVPDYDII